MAFTFFGGVHPKDHKKYSCQARIHEFPEPDLLVIPMQQHIGAPCKPLVAKGDHVNVGQKIGDGEGLCAPIHASVSGTVKAVEMKPHASGMMVMSVVIENDHQKTLDPSIKPRSHEKVWDMTPDQLLKIIREAGIVGMGGAQFPTHVKLQSGMGKVDTIIINCSECEPYITADDRLCQERPWQMLEGVRVIMRILKLKSAVVVMENNKPEAAKIIRREIDPRSGITLKLMPAKYPQGAEKQLIQAVTGRQVPSGKLPADVGCAVFNVATCKAIYDAVFDGVPLIQRVVTVTGDIAMEPKNLLAPIGTSFNELLEAVGHSGSPYKILSGGPMMGYAQFDLNVPIMKGTNAITMLGFDNQFAVSNPHCIRCGKCMSACPMKLMPLQMYRAEQDNDLQTLQDLHLMDCIECGCCAYSCPATIPLVQVFRSGKQKLRDASAKK